MRPLLCWLLVLSALTPAALPGDPRTDFDRKLADARAAKSQADAAAAEARDEMQRARGAADQAAKEAKAAKAEADRKARDAGKAKNTPDNKLKHAVAEEARITQERIKAEQAALRKSADAAKARYDQLVAQARDAGRRLDDLLAAAPLPMSGFAVPELRAFDDAMLQFMRQRGIKAGTLAVMKDGRVVLSRSYGYADAKRTLTLGPDPPLRIASISKPITAAAVLRLIREGKLKLDTKAFALLALKPPPGKADPRLADITIRHLLDHQGGWDKEATFDPMFQSVKIAAALGKRGPAGADDIVSYMAGQPLQFAPGSQTKYSNFGYCVLGRVIEKLTGKRYVDYVCDDLLYPLKIKSVELARSLPRDRNPREPFYFDPKQAVNVMEPDSPAKVPLPDGGLCLEALDSAGGLTASAADLVRFADGFTIKGEPRTSGSRRPGRFVAKGSLPGTASALVWREDGVNMAALLNQRTGPSGQPFENTIARVLDQVADGIKTWPGPR
jgi:N-acyl-D-amino-acid deacylase